MTPGYLTVIRRDGPLVKMAILRGEFDPPYAKVFHDDCIEKLFRHPQFGWLLFFDYAENHASNNAETLDDRQAVEWLLRVGTLVPPDLEKIKEKALRKWKLTGYRPNHRSARPIHKSAPIGRGVGKSG